jgi:hypothetical protein
MKATFTIENKHANELLQAIELYEVEAEFEITETNFFTKFFTKEISEEERIIVYKIIDNIQSR